LRFRASGAKAGANGNKTLKFHFDTKEITFHAAANDTNDWRFEATVEHSAATSQKITWVGWNGTTMTQGYDTHNADLTGDVTVKITGECAHASDTIYQLTLEMERY
jgi:hypothetical protein